MTIKDILTITGGNTRVVIFSADKEDRYIRLWYGIVDDIHFPHVPYGYYDVEHVTVINKEDILQLHFEYPELSKDHINMISEEAVGYPYPTDWIEKLFIKYRDWEYIREILTTKSKDEVYNEIRIIPDEEVADETVSLRLKLEGLMEDIEEETIGRHMNDREYSRWETLQEVIEILDEI